MEQVNFKRIVKEFTTLEVEKIKLVTNYSDITMIKIEINKTCWIRIIYHHHQTKSQIQQNNKSKSKDEMYKA